MPQLLLPLIVLVLWFCFTGGGDNDEPLSGMIRVTALVVVRATTRFRFLRGIVGNLRDDGGLNGHSRVVAVHWKDWRVKQIKKKKETITKKQPIDKLLKNYGRASLVARKNRAAQRRWGDRDRHR